MSRIVVTEFISLDGVMEAPGGDDNFVRGQWSFEFDRGDEGNQFKADETMEADALLLGRRTYEGFAAAWPGREGEFADKFNTMPKYVVSSTLTDPDWGNTTVLSGDVAEEVEAARGRWRRHHRARQRPTRAGACGAWPGGRAAADGLPVVLGTGKRLFGDTSDSRRFAAKSSQIVGDGVVLMIYEPA